ncbi:MAG: hypothetical protein U9P49_06185 [Thermodesulfobacteriota bacterium]|nr:hypothetical protein [Thermodesulfobacteriota bacterium]
MDDYQIAQLLSEDAIGLGVLGIRRSQGKGKALKKADENRID